MSQYAKAIAAVVTPLVVWAITWLANNAGIDVTPDQERVGQAVLVVITAITVFLTRNTTNPPEEG